MTDPDRALCPPAELDRLLAAASADTRSGLQQLDAALAPYGGDPRLHFLRGSLLAAEQRYPEALEAMGAAVDLAPGYDVARFQLGLLQLSSGLADAARATLSPLAEADAGYLARFAAGLLLLIEDRLQEARAALDAGVRENTALPPMNADMTLLRDEITRYLESGDAGPQVQSSSTELMLRYLAKRSVH